MTFPDPPKRYFSERHGRGPKAEPLSHEQVRRLVVNVLDDLNRRDYFQEAFGYTCVDAGDVDGTLGADPSAFFLRTIMRDGVWPWWLEAPVQGFRVRGVATPRIWETWNADTMFDIVEVLHDLVSAPDEGYDHDYNHCGWHYTTFKRTDGQVEYRNLMNGVLVLGDPAYQLNDLGQLVESGPAEFRDLLAAPVPPGTEHDLITSKIDAAVERFRSRGASLDDRRHAVRDLADVLEALRSDVKVSMLKADEGALFHLANGFAVRHNNREQRGDYDRVTWLRWAFYVYLATIHAVLRVRNQQNATGDVVQRGRESAP